MYNEDSGWVAYPVDVVISFELQDQPSTAPREAEVWISTDEQSTNFVKVAAATLEATPGEHSVTLPARGARYVKLRVLAGASKRVLEIAGLRAMEAAGDGYVPLFTRAPFVQRWKGSPREAAPRGVDWLPQSAADWDTYRPSQEGYFGCHVQAHALMDQQAALEQAGASVHTPMFKRGVDYLLRRQITDASPATGSWKAVHTRIIRAGRRQSGC